MDEYDFRDFRIQESLREDYEQLVNRRNSPFQNQEKSGLFVLAAVVGWEAGLRRDVDGPYVLFGKSSLDDEQEWILKSIAAAETDDIETLEDGNRVREIAEEYANGGMHEILRIREGPKELVREVSNRMLEVGREFDLGSEEF